MFEGYDPKVDMVILTQKVPRTEAPRFGIMETDGTKITSFREKPSIESLPDQMEFNASMGVYFAPHEVWKEVLEEDQRKRPFNDREEKDPETQTSYDIGGDVIPSMMGRYNLHVFNFDGFWEDVGEPKALYRANRRLFLEREPDLFGNPALPIEAIADHHFEESDNGRYFASGRFDISRSNIRDSIFSPGVVGRSSELLNSVFLGESDYGTDLGTNSHIDRAIVDKDVTIGRKVTLTAPENHLMIVSRQTKIPNRTRIEATSDAFVAPLDEMVAHLDNIIGYRRRVSPHVELYTPDGTRVTIDELLELKTN